MIYADYNGSAPMCDDVKKFFISRLEKGPFANPNAIHHLGLKTLAAMENSRSLSAKALGCSSNQIVFNSGSTEGISQVFFSLLSKAKAQGKTHFIVSSIEHSAVLNNAKFYEKEYGLILKILPCKTNGVIDLEQLQAWIKELSDRLAMVSIMAANNETGVIQPISEISKACFDHKIPFFSDTTQWIGKHDFNFKQSGLDYAVLSGHKIGALTGTGILIAKDPTTLRELIIGGGQERGLRGGTQHYLGYETLAVALNFFNQTKDQLEALSKKRSEFEQKIKKEFPKVIILGEESPRLAGTTLIAYPGLHGQAVQIELESNNIFVTTSSACSDNEPVTSKVLKAMNVADDVGRGVVRISLCHNSPLEYYDQITDTLIKAYKKLAQIKSF